MHLLIYGPGRLGGAIAHAAADEGWTSTLIGRPDPGIRARRRPARGRRGGGLGRRGGRRQPRPRARGRQSPVHRSRPAPGTPRPPRVRSHAARARRCRGRRPQPRPRARRCSCASSSRPPRCTRARRVRAVDRGVAPPRQGGPSVRHRAPHRPPDHGRRTPAGPGPTSTTTTAPPSRSSGIRAGVAPGTHLVTFDGPGESVELRLTARDRTAYADGALAAARWLVARDRGPRPPPVRCRRGRPPGRRAVAGRTAASAPDPTTIHRPSTRRRPQMTRITRSAHPAPPASAARSPRS